MIRATSLSGVANHYVSITPGPNNAPELADDATLTGADTTTPVDLDQLFDTFNGPARKSLRQFIQGFSDIYVGKGPAGQQDLQVLRALAASRPTACCGS